MAMRMMRIYFVNKFSPEQRQIPFPVAPNVKLVDMLPELAKKFQMTTQNITLTCQDSQVLTPDDYELPMKVLTEKFGTTFNIIDRNIVGGSGTRTDAKYSETLIDVLIPEFGKEWSSVGPDHPRWRERLKMEIAHVFKYINYLKQLKNEPWFRLVPSKNPAHNYRIWEGHILIPSRKEIMFKIKVLLTKEFPKVCPRCFAEEKILDYCGKMYFGNEWNQPGENQKYLMICHDHMKVTDSWNAYLGIVHFFIREVWVWWAAQQNFIIQTWDEIHKK